MASQESYQIRKTLVNDRETLAIPLAVQRQEWAAAAAQVPLLSGITVTPVAAPTVAGEWLNPATSTMQGVLFYLHGGGYVAGSPLTHRELAARLSLVTGLRVLLIDYRLAPEHPFPAALEDPGLAIVGCCSKAFHQRRS